MHGILYTRRKSAAKIPAKSLCFHFFVHLKCVCELLNIIQPAYMVSIHESLKL